MNFILTHEYLDKSGFTVCGITCTYNLARTWYLANDENNVYPINKDDEVVHPMKGYISWRQEEKDRVKFFSDAVPADSKSPQS